MSKSMKEQIDLNILPTLCELLANGVIASSLWKPAAEAGLCL